MSLKQWIAPVLVVTGAVVAASGQPAAPNKAAALEPVSPAEVIRQPEGQRVTVEFRVATATLGRFTDRKPKEPRTICLSPGILLPNGGRFEAILMGNVVTCVDKLGLLEGDRPDKFFYDKVVRVSGELYSLGPKQAPLYRIQVDDMDAFEVVRLRLD